jgi:AbrB family looped-hinge helix DNA binding protein
MKFTAKISEQGQITLPKTLRQKIGVETGSRVILEVDDSLTIKVGTEYPIKSFFGTFGSSISGHQDATEMVSSLRTKNINNRFGQSK